MADKTLKLLNQPNLSLEELVKDLEQLESCSAIRPLGLNRPLLPSTAFKLGYAFCLGKTIICRQSILKIILG